MASTIYGHARTLGNDGIQYLELELYCSATDSTGSQYLLQILYCSLYWSVVPLVAVPPRTVHV